jgi:glycosyltransferase involved in cell wall biosynthesis
MHIGFFTWSLELGGVEHMMINMSRELTDRGHSVQIVLARSPLEDIFHPDPRVKRIWLNARSTPQAIVQLAHVMRKQEFDVVFTGMPTSNIVVILARALGNRKTKVVVSERSNPTLEAAHAKTWRYRAAFFFQPYLYPAADAIVAVCSDLADELSKVTGLHRESIKVIYNPAFDDRVPNQNSGVTPHPWLASKEIPIVITAGRLQEQKDYSTFLKAIALLAVRKPVRAIILGDGPLLEDLKREALDLGIGEHVAFPGFVENVTVWFERAAVFALSSKWEGFGNALVQALAAGCSIVSTDCPNGPSEILEGGKYGRLSPVGDANAFAEALEAALAQPFAADQQRARAREFTVTKSADQYETLFRSLVS